MRKDAKIDRIIELSDQALNNPDIQRDDALLETINKINSLARNGELPKDGLRIFVSQVTNYSQQKSNYLIPEYLNELISLIPNTPFHGDNIFSKKSL